MTAPLDPQECAAAARRGAGLFALEQRGVLAVEGRDARRWLNGMVSNDVSVLAAQGTASDGRAPQDTEPSGADAPAPAHCYACLLTPIGRIVADLHVVARPEGFWLDLERHALGDVAARLEKYVIAEDVAVREAGLTRLALEGPAAPSIARAARPALAAAGAATADYALGGGPGVQLFVPPEGREAVLAALREAGAGRGLVEGDPAALEILRVEGGVPRLGAELGEDVLPPEAGLDAAISTTKGCYTGQEVVARIRSRGQVKHRLVGLRLEPEDGAALPALSAAIDADGRRVGEVTSAVLSPTEGPIALGFVTRPHDAPGTSLRVAGRAARVVALPFVPPPPPPDAAA